LLCKEICFGKGIAGLGWNYGNRLALALEPWTSIFKLTLVSPVQMYPEDELHGRSCSSCMSLHSPRGDSRSRGMVPETRPLFFKAALSCQKTHPHTAIGKLNGRSNDQDCNYARETVVDVSPLLIRKCTNQPGPCFPCSGKKKRLFLSPVQSIVRYRP